MQISQLAAGDQETKTEVSILILSSFTIITDLILNQKNKGTIRAEVTEECSQLTNQITKELEEGDGEVRRENP